MMQEKKINDDKSRSGQKLLLSQKKALEKYGAYLAEQLAAAPKGEADKKHRVYIETQISLNNKKIANIDAKL